MTPFIAEILGNDVNDFIRQRSSCKRSSHRNQRKQFRLDRTTAYICHFVGVVVVGP
jgi:hypothetical protein